MPPIAFDPARLAADLAGLHAIAWTEHFVTPSYEGDWSIIALRQAATSRLGLMDISDPDCSDYVETAAAAACPYFRLNGSSCPMPAGSAWWFRLADPHSVTNRGQTDRVLMLVDLAMSDWLAALLAQAAGTAAGRAA